MQQEKMFLASAAVELAESEDKSYVEITNRICYYGEPNLNNVILPVEGAEEKAQTLVDMPVVAKYRPITVGNKRLDDLGGHEMYVDPTDNKIKFATEIIGTHISTEIKDDEVEINGVKKTLPCLFAKARIWARNEKIYSAIKRLYNEGKLFSSWEIATKKFEFTEGLKTLTDYTFLGNCFLGSRTQPSYPCAQAISMASLNEASDELVEALTVDVYKEETMAKNKKTVTEVSEDVAKDEVVKDEIDNVTSETTNNEDDSANENSETLSNGNNKEVSSLTEWDLKQKIQAACSEKANKYLWCCLWLPAENTVWCEYEGRKSELDFLVFTYTVNGDEVEVSDPIEKSLSVSISEIDNIVSEKDKAIAEKDEALVSANAKITELSNEIAELAPFKEAAEKAAFEKAEAEKAEKRESLKAYAIKSTHITAEECENDETIAKMIAEIDEDGIKRLIVDRFMSSLQTDIEQKVDVETSSVKETVNVRTNLNSSDDETSVGNFNPVKAFVNS